MWCSLDVTRTSYSLWLILSFLFCSIWVGEDCDCTYKRELIAVIRKVLWWGCFGLTGASCLAAQLTHPGLPGSQNPQPNGPWLISCGFSSLSPRAKVLRLGEKGSNPRKAGPKNTWAALGLVAGPPQLIECGSGHSHLSLIPQNSSSRMLQSHVTDKEIEARVTRLRPPVRKQQG